MMSVLFVCTANICRSPTAEGVMRRLLCAEGMLARVEVASAATHDYQLGMPPSAGAMQVAQRRGYPIGERVSRRVSPADFDHYDLILAMDRANLAALQDIAPPRARPKIGMLLDYGERHRGKEVPDPYGGSEADYDATLELIEDGCRGLLKALAR